MLYTVNQNHINDNTMSLTTVVLNETHIQYTSYDQIS